MALIALASAKGSPGVTTMSLAVGGLWPRPVVLAECDPAGGDVAVRMPADDGSVLDPQRGLLSLAAAGRQGLHAGLLGNHTQRIVGGLDVLVGVNYAEQSIALAERWNQLGPLLCDLVGLDVVADLGRLGATTPQRTLLRSADAVVLVTDTTPSNVVHLRHRVADVLTVVGGRVGAPVHVAVVAEPKRSRAVREVEDALARAELAVAGVHLVASDRRGANVFQGQVRGDSSRTALVRSLGPMVGELARATERRFVETSPVAGDRSAASPIPSEEVGR